jgi:hypothetical protein
VTYSLVLHHTIVAIVNQPPNPWCFVSSYFY